MRRTLSIALVALCCASAQAQDEHWSRQFAAPRTSTKMLPGTGMADGTNKPVLQQAKWHDGKLWLSSLRLRGNLRVDPETWEPEYMIPFHFSYPDWVRYHGIAIHDGSLWQIIGNNWILWLVWVIGAFVGIGAQLSMVSRVTLPEARWTSVSAQGQASDASR